MLVDRPTVSGGSLCNLLEAVINILRKRCWIGQTIVQLAIDMFADAEHAEAIASLEGCFAIE